MCGIVGYVGDGDSVSFVTEGLKRLEYRGYDSAGVAAVAGGRLEAVKSQGKLAQLRERLEETPIAAPLAIGHTRWATHGVPSEANSHPHFDGPMEIAIVHNGIIENYQELRAGLISEGVEFRSDTDTETIAHLIRKYYDGDLFAAVKRALRDVRGAYAIGVICKDHPDLLVAARHGSPLVVGLGDGANFIGSDATPLLRHTHDVIFLEDDQVCALRSDGYVVHNLAGEPQDVAVQTVPWDDAMAEKEGYPHFMLKEIHEQPAVIRHLLRGRTNEVGDDVVLEDVPWDDGAWRECPRVTIIACGTAYHAGLVGKRLIETLARLPVDTEIASEYRYKDPFVESGAVVVPVTQSGETADTLEATRLAQQRGARTLALVNAPGSTSSREADALIYLRAGIEIGVASTKAYTAMIAAFVLLAVRIGRARGTLDAAKAKAILGELRAVPDLMQACIDRNDFIEGLAREPKYRDAVNALFLGRCYNLPTAFEGALKLKEISYIHAEGYGAGEMKHGPIALVTEKVPVVCLAPRSDTYEKMVSNIREIRARNGIVLAVATEGDAGMEQIADDILYIPACSETLSPLVAVVPLQLFAYHVSIDRGCDVDQPRNLAKSVTVE